MGGLQEAEDLWRFAGGLGAAGGLRELWELREVCGRFAGG